MLGPLVIGAIRRLDAAMFSVKSKTPARKAFVTGMAVL
jgi:hypothetical protein